MRIVLSNEEKCNHPLFHNYVDKLDIQKWNKSIKTIKLKQSTHYGSYEVFATPNKLISSIIDYSVLKK